MDPNTLSDGGFTERAVSPPSPSKRSEGSAPRKVRSNTWSDAELEEMYNIQQMVPETATKAKNLLQVMKAIRHCNKAKTLDSAITLMVENACSILGCDRATLFMVDEIAEELVIRQAVGIEDIRIPLDSTSIAGSVYHNGVKLNIPDAYKDDRFNKSADEASGYVTKSLLCTPIWDENYQPVAVLQAVNKIAQAGDENEDKIGDANGNGNENVLDSPRKFTTFTAEDEVLMDHLSLQLGVILRNQMFREQSERSHNQVLSLLDIVKSLHSDMGVNSLMFTITERSPRLVDAARCTMYAIDRKHNELWSLQGAIEIRVPINKGLVGYTATTGEVINILDAHKDERFNTEFDLKTGFRTKSVLVMPIFSRPSDDSEPEVIGVLQVINKLHGPRFTEEDEQLLRSFLDIIGSLLMTSQLFVSSLPPKVSEFGAAQDILNTPSPIKRGSSNSKLQLPNMILEEEEDEGDTLLEEPRVSQLSVQQNVIPPFDRN
mmetsp:Transcript_21327/g.37758  ORF Transcript_21327/g.37758 Transcript_21327/m.37758 type:complete len:489 (-) Transcript_21327:121-1587(-)